MSISPNFLRRTAIVSALALSALGASVSTASASVLWTANAERQWIQEWANYSCESGDRVQEVTSPVAQGKQAYKIEVRDGDDSYGERCELGQANPTRAGFPLFQEGDERWISYQVMLPDDLNVNLPQWTVIMQLKQLGGLGTPAVAMDIENGHFILQNSDTNHESSGCNWWWEGPAYKNRWLKFTYHIKFSPDDNVGWIELYGDQGDGLGMHELMPRTFMHTMKVDADGKTVPSHSRIGLYRDPAIQGTSHIYYDGYTVGTDRQSVEDAAYGNGGTFVPPAPTRTATPTTTTNPGASTPAATPPKHHSTASKRARISLKVKKRHGLLAAAANTPWGHILPVYGRVRSSKAKKGHGIVIEMRRHGHWVWLTRGWLRSGGRYYLSPAIDVSSGTHVVKLRAVVPGVGHSKILRTRIR